MVTPTGTESFIVFSDTNANSTSTYFTRFFPSSSGEFAGALIASGQGGSAPGNTTLKMYVDSTEVSSEQINITNQALYTFNLDSNAVWSGGSNIEFSVTTSGKSMVGTITLKIDL